MNFFCHRESISNQRRKSLSCACRLNIPASFQAKTNSNIFRVFIPYRFKRLKMHLTRLPKVVPQPLIVLFRLGLNYFIFIVLISIYFRLDFFVFLTFEKIEVVSHISSSLFKIRWYTENQLSRFPRTKWDRLQFEQIKVVFHVSSSRVEIRLHVKNQFPRLSRTVLISMRPGVVWCV